jgi:hypothetical protein
MTLGEGDERGGKTPSRSIGNRFGTSATPGDAAETETTPNKRPSTWAEEAQPSRELAEMGVVGDSLPGPSHDIDLHPHTQTRVLPLFPSLSLSTSFVRDSPSTHWVQQTQVPWHAIAECGPERG